MGKNIVICTDGTWNTPDQMDRGRMVPSNVVKICRALDDRDAKGVKQYFYYHTGVGTAGWRDKLKGGIFGIGLSENILHAYKALATHYRDGDSIFLFGFSRGAYTARSIGGLIGRCGILNVDAEDLEAKAKEAFKIYRLKPGDKKTALSQTFREANSHPSNEVMFIGVWDTVGALGVPLKSLNWIGSWRHKFHEVTLGSYVRNAYHAVAIDERRRPFRPTLWQLENETPGQTVVQAWFPGVHSNVGGGYADSGLSDRALDWMIENAAGCGLKFQDEYLDRRIDPNYHGELRDSMSNLYKVTGGGKYREIGNDKAAEEMIHFGAEKRAQHSTNNYQPPNLMTALGTVPLTGEPGIENRANQRQPQDHQSTPAREPEEVE